MTDDAVRAALRPLLATLRSPQERRAIAAALDAIAAEQRALADAATRDQRKPPQQRVRGGVGGRPSAPWVRIKYEDRGQEVGAVVRVILSRSLYYALGQPARMDVQRHAGQLVLQVVNDAAGYAVTANRGGISLNASGARDLIDREAGRYGVTVAAGRVMIGERLAS